MSNDAMITLQGWLGGPATLRQAGEVPVTNFRIGCTPRRFHRARQEWVDDETQWYTVTAWRALAENCARSLRKGDPILVHGRLSHRTYRTKDGVEAISLEIDAVAVGHDLNRGGTFFTKVSREESVSRETPAAGPADLASTGMEGPSEGPVGGVDSAA